MDKRNAKLFFIIQQLLFAAIVKRHYQRPHPQTRPIRAIAKWPVRFGAAALGWHSFVVEMSIPALKSQDCSIIDVLPA